MIDNGECDGLAFSINSPILHTQRIHMNPFFMSLVVQEVLNNKCDSPPASSVFSVVYMYFV